jgi:hypothetical protein
MSFVKFRPIAVPPVVHVVTGGAGMAEGSLEERLRSAERGLAFYRVVALVLLATLGGIGWMLSRQAAQVSPYGAPDAVWTVDLAARRAAVEQERGDLADFSETYFQAPDASVHMHFMGHLQTTPLHLHPGSSEATIVAGGTAEVTHAWGEGGEVRTKQGVYPTGSLVGSPAYTAHEFHNPDEHAMLANLVFTAPLFGGNFYVHPDDPRVLKGPPPTTADVVADLPAFVASGAPAKLVRLGALEGRMSELLVATTWTAPANPGKPMVAYVAAGEGDVDGHAVRAGTLVHLASSSPIGVTAKPGSPLALVVFDPHGALPAAVADGS